MSDDMDNLADFAEQVDRHGRREDGRGRKLGHRGLTHRMMGPDTKVRVMRRASCHPSRRPVTLPAVTMPLAEEDAP